MHSEWKHTDLDESAPRTRYRAGRGSHGPSFGRCLTRAKSHSPHSPSTSLSFGMLLFDPRQMSMLMLLVVG
ncbi:hypothetical protein M407DRAFT_204465 [Tulasnella calospora MUT 4182]|uniref:Uncharacterized protein n=1 Tax=Tulasnella calospora MUT 4182 TaxID=1051891 RepID=A0A0C3MH83_9AGAM|nr:hypothetical protein M407DRAFT_204465 [Tulasnella calospora MUT 4182]